MYDDSTEILRNVRGGEPALQKFDPAQPDRIITIGFNYSSGGGCPPHVVS
jgi:hypothetical protein